MRAVAPLTWSTSGPESVTERVPRIRRWRRWLLRLLVVVLLFGAACCVYDASTYASMQEERDETPRLPRSKVAKGAGAFVLRADGDRACLLLHGFASSPGDFGNLPSRLHAGGLHVEAPLLPGHGTTPEDHAATDADELIAAARTSYDDLSKRFRHVSVVGFSMGGAISVVLASETPPHRLVLWAPYASVTHRWYHVLPARTWTGIVSPLIRYVRKSREDTAINDISQVDSFFAYRHLSTAALQQLYDLGERAHDRAERITSPALVIHSREDRAASPTASREMYDAFESSDKQFLWVDASNHILGWDHDRETVVATTVAFLTR